MDSHAPFVGIDVPKAHLDVAIRPAGRIERHCNDPVGVATIVSPLQPLAPTLVFLEPTGGRGWPLVAALVWNRPVA